MSTTQIGAITNRFCYLQATNKTTLRQTRTHAKANSRPSPKDTNIFGCESTTSWLRKSLVIGIGTIQENNLEEIEGVKILHRLQGERGESDNLPLMSDT